MQILAPNESLLCRFWLQMNLYCADSGSKRISTAQTLAPNESLLRRLWLQINLYCADSGSKLISTAQILKMNLYCTDSDSKLISTAQTLAPNDVIYSRWQRPYWDALDSLFYSGRNWRCVVHLFVCNVAPKSLFFYFLLFHPKMSLTLISFQTRKIFVQSFLTLHRLQRN